ncbi:hypothetical protein A9Q78_11035 [Methylophaga sp. 41_12_T18]|nr:hypothetical protein A9Q78_11035 [Methylophaga sp. 41_12_T18]
MTFVNELIRNEDVQKYDIVRLLHDTGTPQVITDESDGDMQWTVDRERGMFLLKFYRDRDSGHTYWFFVIEGKKHSVILERTHPVDGKTHCQWDLISIQEKESKFSKDEVVSYLKEALTTYGHSGCSYPTPEEYQIDFTF